MKKIFILIFSFLFFSCFTEHKKKTVKNIENSPLYVKETISLDVLNKIIFYQKDEFIEWCVAQNFTQLRDDDLNFYNDDKLNKKIIEYANNEQTCDIILEIPNNSSTKRCISFNTS